MDANTFIIAVAVIDLLIFLWFAWQFNSIALRCARTAQETEKIASNTRKATILLMAMANKQGMTQDDFDEVDP